MHGRKKYFATAANCHDGKWAAAARLVGRQMQQQQPPPSHIPGQNSQEHRNKGIVVPSLGTLRFSSLNSPITCSSGVHSFYARAVSTTLLASTAYQRSRKGGTRTTIDTRFFNPSIDIVTRGYGHTHIFLRQQHS